MKLTLKQLLDDLCYPTQMVIIESDDTEVQVRGDADAVRDVLKDSLLQNLVVGIKSDTVGRLVITVTEEDDP